MTDEEKYNKYYNGRLFIIPYKRNNLDYYLGDIEYNDDNDDNGIKITWGDLSNITAVNSTYCSVNLFFYNISNGIWVMDIKRDRKLKLKKLLK